MKDTPQLCIDCRKRPAFPRAIRCFLCNKRAAAAMYRRWKQEMKTK